MAASPDPRPPAQQIADRLGAQPPPDMGTVDDPAFLPPRDPLSGVRLIAEAGLVYRDNPIVTIATSWEPEQFRAAGYQLIIGNFDLPSQLIDTMVGGDSRILSALRSRVGGLLGRSVEWELPKGYEDSAGARECLDAMRDAWDLIAPESFLAELHTWEIFLGHGHGTIAWDTSGEYAIPHPRVWHPRYTYFNWDIRRIVANTKDGQQPIEPGRGHWILGAPNGMYRGWMRGCMRAVAPWFYARQQALRDAARWSEVHGLPLVKLKHPASADRDQVEQFRSSMATRGGETCVDLPQGVPEAPDRNSANANYDIEYLEAMASTFDGFFRLISQCNEEITLAIQHQILSSTMPAEGRGSWAAARVHADTRQMSLEADARAEERTLYTQIARPFAAMNFGDPNLAPRCKRDITPYEDFKTKAETALHVSQVLVNLANAGWKVKDVQKFARQFGMTVGDLLEVTPRIGAGGAMGSGRESPASGARARFAKVAEEHVRLRIALGQSTRAEIEREVEAMAAMVAENEAAERRQRRLASR